MSNPGYFGEYGGTFAPETLMAPLAQLSEAYEQIKQDPNFIRTLEGLLQDYVGRPSPLYFAQRLSHHFKGAKLYLKREDLNHTGAHKINNCLGQGLLAKFMGKENLIAETGAGQHGVATATIASLLGLSCTVFMGKKDMARQALNVARMEILGAKVIPVLSGSQTLKEATSEAMRYWVSDVKKSYYLIGSVLGPHPYPTIVRDFQKVIGIEARAQILVTCQKLPDELIACVGGGSNALGLFTPFLEDHDVAMTGVEAGGKGIAPNAHAARFADKKVGVLQGTKTYILQNEAGQIAQTASISAGLDYPAVGPEHAFLHDKGRVQYVYATDEEALKAAFMLAKFEGIIPALESAHALAYAIQKAPTLSRDAVLLINLSGRGDKDVPTLSAHQFESRI